MAIEDSGLIPKEVSDSWDRNNKADFYKKQQELAKTRLVRRSTYTSTNAELFRAFFDMAINEGKEYLMPYDSLRKVTPNTFYVKVCDALKYLIDNEEDALKQRNYTLLKATYKIVPEVEGVALRQKIRMAIPIAQISKEGGVSMQSYGLASRIREINSEEESKSLEDSQKLSTRAGWKSVIEDFVNNPEVEGHKSIVFERELTQEDKLWIANIFSGVPNTDFLISGLTLQMMKEKV